MKKTFLLSSGLILLLCTPLSFSQQRGVIKNDSKPEAPVATDKCSYDDAVAIQNSTNPRYGIQLFPARGRGGVDWGLALSGGGIRSAAFSIGAMKALYDKDLMKEIDVISSVSGGGYASYWLFTNYAQHKSQTPEFGEAAFRNDRFIKNVCELQNLDKSNLVTGKQYLSLLWKGRKKTFDEYKEAIRWSFGPHEPGKESKDECFLGKAGQDERLCFLNHEIEEKEAPYFIINTTLRLSGKDKKKTRELQKESSAVFEISPHFRGNPVIGFSNWTKEDEKDTILSKSVAMSGAPHIAGPLGVGSEIKNVNKNAVAGSALYLHDGGQSENLGALALIRRGVRNVIIIDAASDPAYKFDAYVELQKMLKDMGVEFCVPNIAKFLNKQCAKGVGIEPAKSLKRVFSASPVSLGRAWGSVEGTPIESRIYYIKMSSPEAILPKPFEVVLKENDRKKWRPEENKLIDKGEKIADERQCQRCTKINADGQENLDAHEHCPESEGKCCCNKIDMNFGSDGRTYEELYAYRIWAYSDVINNPEFSRFKLWAKVKSINAAGKTCYFVSRLKGFNGLGPLICSNLSYNFPHTTTFDQSMFSDQLEAFVGLGYLQTMKLEIRPDQ
jgi:hypothetical protein